MKYAREENNTIVVYHILPNTIRDGEKYVTITESNASDYGFKPLTIPEFDGRTHKRSGNIVATGAGYEYEVVSLNKTVEDFQEELNLRLKGYWKEAFAEGKPYMDYLTATSQSVPTDVQTKINALYGLLGTIKGQIAALSTVEEALAYEMPMTDINEGLEYLRKLI